jgi:hypothetical protein
MPIRSIDHSPDQSAQNPPPEHELGEAHGRHRDKALFVGGVVNDAQTCVLRGAPVGGMGVGVTWLVTVPHAASAEGNAPAASSASQCEIVRPARFSNFVELPHDGWFLRNLGTYRIQSGDHEIVCKVHPRWEWSAARAGPSGKDTTAP